MERLAKYFRRFLRLATKHLFWWVVMTLGLAGIYFIAKATEPTGPIVFQQLAILYLIDSALFFLTDRVSARMGLLTLIFLATMEIIVTIFYLITYFSASRF